MDPKIAKKTQDTLGKIIKKPPLTDKLLGKPPFRFLHDIMTSVIKSTGFMKGLFTDSEMNSENVKDKDSKIAFLQKSIDFVCMVSGKSLSAKPSKIVAGHEPERTNEFLVALANAINSKADNDECIKKFFNKGKDSKEERDDRKKDRSDEKRKKDREEKSDRGKSADRHRGKSTDRDEEREERKEEKRDRERSRDRDREERHRDRDRERRKKHRDEEAGKENETPADMMNGEAEKDKSEPDPPPRMARPTSAKGSRRRREEDEGTSRSIRPSDQAIGEGDLPPQVAAARGSARPSSARPAPPKRKQEIVENEPAMRLGSGKPTNVIVDDGKGDEDEDDDETFVVEETAPPPTEAEQTVVKPEEEEDGDHGGLVKKMLESKKELEGGSQQKSQTTKKTEIERPTLTDAQRRKQREQIQKEIDKLRGSIQTLTRSANPLGKIMDYVQEDLDSMQKELQKWKVENKEHALALKREKNVTDKAVEPLKAQLSEVDQAIKDQLDLIAAVKSNIIRNDVKIEKMLTSIAKS